MKSITLPTKITTSFNKKYNGVISIQVDNHGNIDEYFNQTLLENDYANEMLGEIKTTFEL